MCAARVEVMDDQVTAKYKGKILGTGPEVYELRNWIGDLDGAHPELVEPADPPNVDVSHISLDFGENSGKAFILSRPYDTRVTVDLPLFDFLSGRPVVGAEGKPIYHRKNNLMLEDIECDFDKGTEETIYPEPFEIRSFGRTFAIVTHHPEPY